MRRHRLLALARAPLAARVDVLRQINARDDLNFSWKTDLVTYESQRLRQIRSEAADARRRDDLTTLDELLSELTGAVWTCEVPQEVLQEVESLHSAVLHKDARLTLEQLVPELDRAHSELDVERATELADRWHKVSESIDLDAADSLSSRVGEALNWVGQQQKQRADQHAFQKCLESIESMLEDHAPFQKLESRFLKAERFGLPIPDLLRNRVAERLDVLQAQSRRRGLLIGFVATLAVAIVTAATFYHWHNLRSRDLVSQHAHTLAVLVDQEKWQPALAYFEQLPLAMQHAPQLMELHGQCQEGLRTENERVAIVAKLLASAEAMDLNSPDYELLRQIKTQAKTADEKQRFAAIEYKVRSRQRELQKAVDEAFLETVNRWSIRLASLERRDSLDDVGLWDMLTELRNDLDQHPNVTAGLKRRAEPLASKLRALIDQKEQAVDERAALQSLFSTVGRPNDFAVALRFCGRARQSAIRRA